MWIKKKLLEKVKKRKILRSKLYHLQDRRFECNFSKAFLAQSVNSTTITIVYHKIIKPNQPVSVLYCETVILSNIVNRQIDKQCQAKVGVT